MSDVQGVERLLAFLSQSMLYMFAASVAAGCLLLAYRYQAEWVQTLPQWARPAALVVFVFAGTVVVLKSIQVVGRWLKAGFRWARGLRLSVHEQAVLEILGMEPKHSLDIDSEVAPQMDAIARLQFRRACQGLVLKGYVRTTFHGVGYLTEKGQRRALEILNKREKNREKRPKA